MSSGLVVALLAGSYLGVVHGLGDSLAVVRPAVAVVACVLAVVLGFAGRRRLGRLVLAAVQRTPVRREPPLRVAAAKEVVAAPVRPPAEREFDLLESLLAQPSVNTFDSEAAEVGEKFQIGTSDALPARQDADEVPTSALVTVSLDPHQELKNSLREMVRKWAGVDEATRSQAEKALHLMTAETGLTLTGALKRLYGVSGGERFGKLAQAVRLRRDINTTLVTLRKRV